MNTSKEKTFFKDIAKNKKAYFDYTILEKFETGISLLGCEVKSIRLGKANLKESYVRFFKDELFLVGCHISPYKQTTQVEQDPTRTRKLLLHRNQLNKLIGKVNEKGLTIVALKLYLKNQRIKLQIGLCHGKKSHDKRKSLKDKAIKRDLERRQ